MKRILLTFVTVTLGALTAHAHAADGPLRVFIRGGKKSHGPGAHEHERFLTDWKPLLAGRGVKVEGGMDLPDDAQLAQTDVILMYAQDGGTVPPSRWGSFDEYLKRGGGIVVVHTAAVSLQPEHWKTVIGGSWKPNVTKWREGPMDLYYTESQRIDGGHPITKGASNFHLDDEIYYDMDISPDVRVLASSYTPNVTEGKKPAEGNKPNIYDIQPQMWTYERTVDGGKAPYRAFVSIPGHLYTTFEKPNYRAILMRGLAWAGKRDNVDEFTTPEEISSLTYPDGGPEKPEDTLKNLEVHPDFDMSLVVAEPLITKPMNFDWDASGRLWVAETPEYPNGRRGMRPDYRGKEWKDHGGIDPEVGAQDRPGQDKVSILTDTNGDGVMDKKDIFYQGLDLVTGLVFYKDGVIVTQAPDILFLRDTDADGKADKVEKLYTNLGTGDTHAVINNPRMGWDGWIYATHGYSASPDVTSGDGSKHFGNIGSGVVRFLPDGSKFEQYSSKGGNTWGLTITGDNRVMWTQPTSGTLLNQVILPEYALARGKVGNTASFKTIIADRKSYSSIAYDQLPYVQIDRVGDFTAGAGAVVYDGGAWPAEYNGDYFTTEPTINIIHHERLTPDKSSFSAAKVAGREETEFVRSKDMWWRPIEVRTGPDGALYVGDFYNQAVIHNDTRGPDHNKVNAAVRPDRDHYFGRIWRIQHKNAVKLAVPDLAKADVPALVAALEHPSRAVRMTASRLLVERNVAPGSKPVPGSPVWKQQYGIDALITLAADTAKSVESRIAALWTLHEKKSLEPGLLARVMEDKSADLRRNAALIIETGNVVIGGDEEKELPRQGAALLALVKDPEAPVRIAALRALATETLSDDAVGAIVAAWPLFDDDFQRSAAVGAASRNPAGGIAAALDSKEPAPLAPLVSQLVDDIARDNNSAAAAKLVVSLADKPAAVDSLKTAVLDTLGKGLKEAPAMTPELSGALVKLLASDVSGSALPLAAKWDTAGALKAEIGKITAGITAKLADTAAPEEARLAAARSLLGLRSANPEAVTTVTKLLGGETPAGLQRGILTALGGLNDPALGAVICGVYGTIPAELQPVAFEALLKRADWTLALLDAIESKKVDPASFGPANAFRLRTYPDKAVSKRAGEMLDQLSPMAKEKNAIIAKLAPEVEKQGDPIRGKLMFQATCATCHKFADLGVDIGPALTGMGSHGPVELLTAIVDPNREVEPSYLTWNIETKDGQFYAGIIVRENATSVTLKSLAGQQEVKVADIKSRVNTGHSLMPEGFDGLGEEMLRDILTYIVTTDGGKFRTVDLSKSFTASTSYGLYISQDRKEDSIRFTKTGTVNVQGIPFNIVSPERSATGNVVVLKGGPQGVYSRSFPQRVEASLGGFKANRIHILGGVAGWGAMDANDDGEPIMKITVTYADGQKEEHIARDGFEFADYIRQVSVPGSLPAYDLVKDGKQLRWFTEVLGRTAPIASVALESYGNRTAPTTVAITAELADEGAPAPGAIKPKTAAAADTQTWGDGTRVLLAGGGSSHDFKRFFNVADTAILKGAGYAVQYTENFQDAAARLGEADVLVMSTNQASFGGLPFRKALEDFTAAGKGLVLLHAGVWYNFGDWADFNKTYVGGGSRGHDKLGPFEVRLTVPEHPVLEGVPAAFTITDELYYATPDPAGAAMDVIASATSPVSGKTFPSIWTVKHPTARIACVSLGHDERAHELPEFKKILTNAVKWAKRPADAGK